MQSFASVPLPSTVKERRSHTSGCSRLKLYKKMKNALGVNATDAAGSCLALWEARALVGAGRECIYS